MCERNLPTHPLYLLLHQQSPVIRLPDNLVFNLLTSANILLQRNIRLPIRIQRLLLRQHEGRAVRDIYLKKVLPIIPRKIVRKEAGITCTRPDHRTRDVGVEYDAVEPLSRRRRGSRCRTVWGGS